jgi:hypothetical protein
MGMNYYIKTNICKSCGKEDNVFHIGKLSFGWTFSFRGYGDFEDGPPIKSFGEWIDFLKQMITDGGKIVDECDKEINFDDFVNLVKKASKNKLNHTIFCKEKYPNVFCDTWLDEEGNSFTNEEFS